MARRQGSVRRLAPGDFEGHRHLFEGGAGNLHCLVPFGGGFHHDRSGEQGDGEGVAGGAGGVRGECRGAEFHAGIGRAFGVFGGIGVV